MAWADSPDDLKTSVRRLTSRFAGEWDATRAELPELAAGAGSTTQRTVAREAFTLLDDIAAELDLSLHSQADRSNARETLRQRIEHFGSERLSLPAGSGNAFSSEELYASTAAFLREAHVFDPSLDAEQLCQALRNVWVGNSLQSLFCQPISLCPALFAYSMLYPVTDNWLDDPKVSDARKRAFSDRLAARLRGSRQPAENDVEARTYRLVSRIEHAQPRARFPCTYASLLAIHESQRLSLAQQHRNRLGDEELLSISVAKGGTSVLANLFLIGAKADPDAIGFAFSYGVALQLLDDLQDLETDLAAGHDTLFTRAARRRGMDEATARLACFIDALLPSRAARGGLGGDRIGLIRRQCIALLVDSVAAHPGRFSRTFRAEVNRRWPVSLRDQRRLSVRAGKLTRQAASALLTRASKGSASDAPGNAPAPTHHAPGSTEWLISAIMPRRSTRIGLDELRSISQAEHCSAKRFAQRCRAALSRASRANEGAAR